MNLAEEDGGAYNTLQMNSGLDGTRNLYGVFRPVQNGTTNAEIFRKVTLCCWRQANRNQWPMTKVIGVNADELGLIWSVRLLLASSCDVAGESIGTTST